jgi:hypothetical protein
MKRLSPYQRTKHPRRRYVHVHVIPQSQRRPWLYVKPKSIPQAIVDQTVERMTP